MTSEHDDDIRDFWTWWATARDRVLAAIEVDRHFSDELVDDISRHVDAIGDLDWELAPGTTAKHSFCLSPKGDPEARVVTELWRQCGPTPDATWEYYPARQPREDLTLGIDDAELEADDLVVAFTVDEGRERIDAQYHHPRFERLDPELHETALYLLLAGRRARGVDRRRPTVCDRQPRVEAYRSRAVHDPYLARSRDSGRESRRPDEQRRRRAA